MKKGLSVCIDAVFQGEEPEKAIYKTAEMGISAVEFWTWEDKNIDTLKEAADRAGVEIAAFCTGFVSLVDAGQRGEYLQSLRKTIKTAEILNCKRIISQVGNETGMERRQQHEVLVEGLKVCVPYLEEAGVTLLLEPLNTRVDHAGYYLYSSDEAFQVVNEVDSKHVKVLFDIYHQQITEGDLSRRIRDNINHIGYFHAAGNPGRHELYHSEVNYRQIFRVIKELKYEDYVGLEYFPVDDYRKGLDYAKQVMG